jgi:hypothetical protein
MVSQKIAGNGGKPVRKVRLNAEQLNMSLPRVLSIHGSVGRSVTVGLEAAAAHGTGRSSGGYFSRTRNRGF